jgi:hypothetical protein
LLLRIPNTVEEEQTTTINGETYYILSGTITSDRTLTNDRRHLISGGLFVEQWCHAEHRRKAPGSTRPMMPPRPFLSIQRGGRINAVGTASAPSYSPPSGPSPVVRIAARGAASSLNGSHPSTSVERPIAPQKVKVEAACTAERTRATTAA